MRYVMRSSKGWYTVCAIYADNMRPYTTVVSASNPERAVQQAIKACTEDNSCEQELIIAAVFEGRLENKI